MVRIAMSLFLVAGSVAGAEQWLQWVRLLPPRQPAWAHTPRMPNDVAYEPVVFGDLVLVGCCHNDALLALDLASGVERWRFYANGPIRFAPATDGDRIFLGSDDGYLYCLSRDGALAWKFRPGPSERKVIGHERLVSAWPISARPLVADGLAYAAAGHWPVDGVSVVALDARTGKVLWRNDGLQFRPHRYVALVGERLVVYGYGGSGVFDRRTGARLIEKPPRLTLPEPPPVPAGVRGQVVGAYRHGDHILVSTREGRLYCFGPTKVAAPKGFAPSIADKPRPKARAPEIEGGWALVLGLRDGSLVRGLLTKPNVFVVAVDPDPRKVDRLRKEFDGEGLFANYRLAVHVGEPTRFGFPPYIASLIASETGVEPTKGLLRSLHPYGGVFLSGGKTIRRDGPPDGAADWTHEFADEANSLCVADEALAPPLGIQWYEGPAADLSLYFDGPTAHDSGDAIVPLPPQAVFVDGRMILQGPGVLAAFDIYTGRQLWRTSLPKTYVFHGVGIHSKIKAREPWNLRPALEMQVPPTHRPRTTGFNYLTTHDAVYVAAGRQCLRFSVKDGSLLSRWAVPVEGEDLCWGNLRVSGDLLVATAFRPHDLVDARAGEDGNGGEWSKDRMPMRYLMVLDRHTGRLLWKRQATWGFLNRGMAVGNGRVYSVDLLFVKVAENFKRAGRKFPQAPPAVMAFELKTGRLVWKHPTNVLIRHLTYSKDADVLLAPARTTIVWKGDGWEEVDKKKGKMFGYRGADGKLLWEVSETRYFEPHIILGDLAIDRYGWTFDLRTGRRHERLSPLTGQKEPWQIRKHGCNHLVASERLVTWRTAFFDLATGIATPLRGMEAGCTPSLIVSGGVLNSPNYGTRIKRARMTTLAMVHVAENELWGSYELPRPRQPVAIRRAGFNFGAPGDRFAEDGTLWLAIGARNRLNVVIKPEGVRWFSRRASPGRGAWVTASGVIGATEILIPTHLFHGRMRQAPPASYDVTLYFGLPSGQEPRRRVFGVRAQGRQVAARLGPAKLDGGRLRLEKVSAGVYVEIKLTPSGEAPPVLSGVRLERRE